MPPVAASTKDGYAVIAHDGIGLKKMVGVSLAGNIYQGAVSLIENNNTQLLPGRHV